MSGVMSHFHAVGLFTQCSRNGSDVKQDNSQQRTKPVHKPGKLEATRRVLMFASYASNQFGLVGLLPK